MATLVRADVARGSSRLERTLRLWLLVVIGCDLGLLTVRLARYPAFFSEPAALSYVFELVATLAIYAAVVSALPSVAVRFPGAPIAVSVGTIAGLVGGIIEMASMTLESLMTLPQPVVTVTTGAAMIGLLLLFGVAGFLGGWRTGSFWLGLGTAIWSAVVAILFAVTFGFLLVNTSLLKLAHDEIGDPDYLRSGWTDVRAYAIANTFEMDCTQMTNFVGRGTLISR